MSEEVLTDDQSHYEISMTAGQAFVAFVLLLLSLAASFAFGLLIGKGQGDERLIVRKDPSVITEASVAAKKPKTDGKIVELGVADDDFKPADDALPATEPAAAAVETPIVTESAPVVTEEAPAPPVAAAVVEPTPKPEPPKPAETAKPAPPAAAATPKPAPPAAAASSGPVYAQLLSTTDQKVAEALATKLIDRGGFTSAYVERGLATEKGPIYRVRVRFPSEGEARAAEGRLKEFSRDVWITR